MNCGTRPKPSSTSKINELLASERLGENISKLITSGYIACLDQTSFICVADEPILGVDVLGALVDVPILDHVNSRLIVDKKGSRERRGKANGVKNVEEPNSLLSGQSSSNKL